MLLNNAQNNCIAQIYINSNRYKLCNLKLKNVNALHMYKYMETV